MVYASLPDIAWDFYVLPDKLARQMMLFGLKSKSQSAKKSSGARQAKKMFVGLFKGDFSVFKRNEQKGGGDKDDGDDDGDDKPQGEEKPDEEKTQSEILDKLKQFNKVAKHASKELMLKVTGKEPEPEPPDDSTEATEVQNTPAAPEESAGPPRDYAVTSDLEVISKALASGRRRFSSLIPGTRDMTEQQYQVFLEKHSFNEMSEEALNQYVKSLSIEELGEVMDKINAFTSNHGERLLEQLTSLRTERDAAGLDYQEVKSEIDSLKKSMLQTPSQEDYIKMNEAEFKAHWTNEVYAAGYSYVWGVVHPLRRMTQVVRTVIERHHADRVHNRAAHRWQDVTPSARFHAARHFTEKLRSIREIQQAARTKAWEEFTLKESRSGSYLHRIGQGTFFMALPLLIINIFGAGASSDNSDDQEQALAENAFN